jgi:1-acyl-sn-glycerol-3-phosphate acyltransferase
MSPRARRLLIAGTSSALRGIYRLLGGFHARGLEHVPAEGPAILAANHLSWADPPAIRAVIARDCWFMANDFLFRVPVLGRLIPLYGAFPVRRGELDRDAIRTAEQHLQDGELVCVFPEGGTTITGTLYPFEGGVALLAVRNDVPIIPIGITGTDRVLPMGAPYPHFARGGVTVAFGPAIRAEEIGADLSRRERVDALTQKLYDAVAALLPPEYLPKPEPTGPPDTAPAEAGRGSHPDSLRG